MVYSDFVKFVYTTAPYWLVDWFVYFQIAFEVAGSLTDVVVDTHRRKHLAYLMADQGALVNPESSRNLPKQVNQEFSLKGKKGKAWLEVIFQLLVTFITKKYTLIMLSKWLNTILCIMVILST